MTVLHPFRRAADPFRGAAGPLRRAAALLAACAVLATGLVALVMSQSHPARAASVGEFTLTPATGSLSAPQPFTGSLGIPGACPEVTLEELNWNSVLALFVVKADGTEVRAMNGITDQAPYTGPASTASLAADANPGMAVSDLTTAVTGDGTYELRVRCMDNMDWSTAPDSVVPGDPFWSQRITVTGDTWVVGEGAEATSVTATASDPAPEPGESTTLTATVTPAEAAGTVTFTEAGTTLGQAPVTNGKAEYATSTLARGTHSIVARFTPSDSAKYGASESTPLTVRVDPPDFELLDATGTRLPLEPALQRGQTVKLVVRGCEPDKAFTMAMGGSDATFPGATSDADGVVTWPALTVPDDAVGGRSKWDFQPGCAGLSAGGVTVLFTVPEPSTSPSSSPTGDPTDDPTDDPSDDPTDAPTDDPTDDPAGDTSGTTSGTVSGTTSGTTAGDGGTGGTSPQGGGLASTGSQVALFSGVGAVVLFAAGVAFVRFGRRNGLLSFGEPRA